MKQITRDFKHIIYEGLRVKSWDDAGDSSSYRTAASVLYLAIQWNMYHVEGGRTEGAWPITLIYLGSGKV